MTILPRVCYNVNNVQRYPESISQQTHHVSLPQNIEYFSLVLFNLVASGDVRIPWSL
jgi:hypothetical protein